MPGALCTPGKSWMIQPGERKVQWTARRIAGTGFSHLVGGHVPVDEECLSFCPRLNPRSVVNETWVADRPI